MRAAWIAGTLMVLSLSSRAGSMSFDDWNRILRERVKPTSIDGVALMGFDYHGLGKARAPFDRTISRLASFNPATLRSKDEKLAFWINAYNIGAVKMVLDHPEVKSLNEVGSRKGAVWKMDALNVGGKSYSLDEIEHQILRKLEEPRIHFAIVCASVSCPDIRAEAYRASGLEAQLEDQVRRFLSNNSKGLRFDAGEKRLVVTKLFEWFAGDFGSQNDLLDFIARHLPKGAQVPAGWREFELGYLDYNWKVNNL